MKKLTGLFTVGSALLIAGIAHAQPGAPTSLPPATTVTTEITTATGAEPSSIALDAPTGTMPTTGGAPIAMALSGILAAGGAFFARRKLA